MSDNELKEIRAWAGRLLPKEEEAIEGLYVHVPFCARKCDYCDFYSVARTTPSAHDDYVQAVLREAELWRGALPAVLPRIQTVFFGGGTPTLLGSGMMRELIRGLRGALALEAVEEWTIEANPATVDGEYLRMLRGEGVDRLSVGVQSFRDEELRQLGRLHDASAAEATIEAAFDAGFARLSADLMFGLPGQTGETWGSNLVKAMSLGLKHLSCYGLTYEEETPLGKRELAGIVERATESHELALLRQTRQTLRAGGLERYEVSNYAVAGEECRHNLLYWSGGNYLGLGPGAASHLSGARWRNPPDVQRWGRGASGGTLVPTEVEFLSPRQRAGELVMLMLRTGKGVHCENFRRRLRMEPLSLFEMELRRFEKSGLLERSVDGFRLSERGFEVMDSVVEAFVA